MTTVRHFTTPIHTCTGICGLSQNKTFDHMHMISSAAPGTSAGWDFFDGDFAAFPSAARAAAGPYFGGAAAERLPGQLPFLKNTCIAVGGLRSNSRGVTRYASMWAGLAFACYRSATALLDLAHSEAPSGAPRRAAYRSQPTNFCHPMLRRRRFGACVTSSPWGT